MKDLTIYSPDEAYTLRFGRRLGELARPGDLFALYGDLGSGKTVLARGAAAGLGISGPVVSPTFTLIREYRGRLPLYHFDLYRLERPEEIEGLGYEEYFYADGLTIVEWADRAPAYLPCRRLDIRFSPEGDGRRLWARASGERYEALLDELGPLPGESVPEVEEEC